jgi:hypothetical protein
MKLDVVIFDIDGTIARKNESRSYYEYYKVELCLFVFDFNQSGKDY